MDKVDRIVVKKMIRDVIEALMLNVAVIDVSDPTTKSDHISTEALQ